MTESTRGERNNNPGNLDFEKYVSWYGQVGLEIIPLGDAETPRFARFDTSINGIRALCRQLLTNQFVHGCDTVRKQIDRFAPPSENNTAAYVAAVAKGLGVDPDAPFDVNNPATLSRAAVEIIIHENGRCLYDAATMAAAVKAALAPAR